MWFMPAGLDGHPDPVVTEQRDAVLAHVAGRVSACGPGRVLIAVDGRSGAGKSTFADELARKVASSGRPVVRSTTDSFHRPREERMRKGRCSPEGYFLDSHQHAAIVDELLRPFAAGSRCVRTAAFDVESDTAVDGYVDEVETDALLIFDGLFLQREELASFWNLTVFLVADDRCDGEWLRLLTDGLPSQPTDRAAELHHRLHRSRWPRYRDGWQLYLDAVDPAGEADLVIDNNDVERPSILRA